MPFQMSRRRISTVLALVILALAAGTSTALAQTRVGIRPSPQPGQVIHVTVEQQVLVRTGEKADEPGPAQVLNKNALAYTQTNGTFDPQGRLDAQVTVERLDLDESLGGRQRQFPDTSNLKGRMLVVTFDRTGKLLGIKVPPDLSDVSGRLTQLLAAAHGMLNFLPSAELAVGEVTTSTSELPMRLPGSMGQGPLEARVNITLHALDMKVGDRIARLKQSIDVATSTSQVKVTGGGTIDVNVDRGFVSGIDTEWNISGVLPTAAGAAQSPPFYGSIKISVTAK